MATLSSEVEAKYSEKVREHFSLDMDHFNRNDILVINHVVKNGMYYGRFCIAKRLQDLMEGRGGGLVQAIESVDKLRRLGLVTLDERTIRVKDKKRLFQKTEYIINDAFYEIVGKPKPQVRSNTMGEYSKGKDYEMQRLSKKEFLNRFRPSHTGSTRMYQGVSHFIQHSLRKLKNA